MNPLDLTGMAQRLDPTEQLRPPSAKRAYPWDEWTDGATWEILSGVDFTGKAEAFRNRLYDVAKRRGMRATAHAFRVPVSVGHAQLSAAFDAGKIGVDEHERLVDHLAAGGRVHAHRGGQPILDPARVDVAVIEGYSAVEEDRPEGVEGLRFRFVADDVPASDGAEHRDASPALAASPPGW